MSGFETLALVAAGASTALQVAGQIRQGQAQKQAANFQAQQMDVNAKSADIAAGQARASAQRTAIEKRHESTLLASKAQAVSAASGSPLDPSTANIISGIDAKGEYGALTALYQGEQSAYAKQDQANVMRSQAGASRIEGDNALNNGYLSAAGTGASFFAKYGSGMFGSTPTRGDGSFAFKDQAADASLPWSAAYNLR